MTEEQIFSDLIDTYFLTLKNKRRSYDTVMFSLHWQRELIDLIDGLLSHAYTPTAKAFMKKSPAPREVIASEFSLRLCDTHIDHRLRPFIEERMSDRVFSNRIGYGNVEAINAVISDIYDVSRGFKNDNCWIIKLDIAGYFPNAIQDFAYHQLQDVLESSYKGEDLDLIRQLLLRCVYSYPAEHSVKVGSLTDWEGYPEYKSIFNKMPGIGGAIGRLIWQEAMNFYLNKIDHLMTDDWGFHYTRFMDDMVIVTDNKDAFLNFIPTIRKELAKIGCSLHPKKFYCQHYTKGVEFLGAVIKKDRVYVSRRIIRNFASRIRYFNRRVKTRNIPAFISSMNSYLGILKGRNTYRLMKSMLGGINPGWWKFCRFDEGRACIKPNPGYTEKEIIYRRYNVKLKPKYQKNGHKRKNRKARGREARPSGQNGSK